MKNSKKITDLAGYFNTSNITKNDIAKLKEKSQQGITVCLYHSLHTQSNLFYWILALILKFTGYNVVRICLPCPPKGLFPKPNLELVKFAGPEIKQYYEEVLLEISIRTSDNLVLGGHSTGFVQAVNQAGNSYFRDKIKGLFGLCPAPAGNMQAISLNWTQTLHFFSSFLYDFFKMKKAIYPPDWADNLDMPTSDIPVTEENSKNNIVFDTISCLKALTQKKEQTLANIDFESIFLQNLPIMIIYGQKNKLISYSVIDEYYRAFNFEPILVPINMAHFPFSQKKIGQIITALLKFLIKI